MYGVFLRIFIKPPIILDKIIVELKTKKDGLTMG